MSEITKSLQELKDEATALGLDFTGMKSKAEISQLIENHYEGVSSADAVQEKAEVEAEEETKLTAIPGKRAGGNPMLVLAKKMKDVAMKTRVVRITNNDKRENHLTTTAYLSCENQYFGISRIVPLDVPIELEQCLIDVAKSVEITLHVDDGNRSGNKEPKLVKKYVISYEDVK